MLTSKMFLKNVWLSLKKNHLINRGKGVYGYMWWSAVRIVLIYLVTFVPLLLIVKQFIDLNSIFRFVTHGFSDPFVLIIFFLSESFLGMIPPDIFVIWTIKFNSPFLFLILLGILSYAGGIISYLIGKWLSNRKRIKAYSEQAGKVYQYGQKMGRSIYNNSSSFPLFALFYGSYCGKPVKISVQVLSSFRTFKDYKVYYTGDLLPENNEPG